MNIRKIKVDVFEKIRININFLKKKEKNLDILINKYFFILLCFSLFISVGLLIAAKPYLAIKVYPDN